MSSPVKNSTNDLTYVKSVKAKYESELMRKPNVLGIGIGLVPMVLGQQAQAFPAAVPAATQRTLGLIVNMSAKPTDPQLIPTELDGVPVTVKETKTIRAW